MMGGPSSDVVETGGTVVDVMEAFGSFVLNIKVLGSDAGVGVPTLPVRVPQIVDANNHLSFSKLMEIVIMIASSQSGLHTTSSSTNETIQHHVFLSFPNPQTQNSVMISSAEELLQLMDRYKNQQQLTLIAKVQHAIVQKKSSSNAGSDTSQGGADVEQQIATPKEPTTSPKSPTRKPSLPMENLNVPDLDQDQDKENHQGQPPTKPTLQFDPPKFKLPQRNQQLEHGQDQESPVLVSLMEQLLEIQSSRMLQFANHMEDRFQHILQERLVTSEQQLKKCLRDTVQLVEEDNDDDSVLSQDSSTPLKPSKTTNLEKVVKDQMVSMELRFAKLEEQSKETAALAKFPSPSRNSPTTTITDEAIYQRLDRLQTTMDSRFQSMERIMESTKKATVVLASSSPSRQTQSSPKPPLPPNYRSTIVAAPFEQLLLPRLAAPPPVSPSILSTPLPLSRPSSPTATGTNTSAYPVDHKNTTRPVSPPTTERSSLLMPPPLTPISPPDSRRSSAVSDTDDTVTDPGMSSCTSNDEAENNDDNTITISNNTSEDSNDNNSNMPESNSKTNMDESVRTTPKSSQEESTPTSPEQIASSAMSSAGFSMPSLADITTESSIPTGASAHRKLSVRDMLMGKGVDDDSSNPKGTSTSKSLPIQFPMLDASRAELSLLSTPPQTTSPPKKTSAFTSPSSSQIQSLPFASSPLTSSSPFSDSKPTTASETKMKQAIKDHMQSMESRVSKLREINKQSSSVVTTTPTTGALTPATALSSPRTLFPDSAENLSPSSMEKVLTQQMNSLSKSLQSTIEDATKASVGTKMADMEALLQRKLQQIQKAVTIATSNSGNNNGPPSSPQRQSSMQVLEEFIESQMEQLTELILSNQEKVVQELVLSRTSVEVEAEGGGRTISVPGSTLMDKLQSVLDRRMDNMESLVQLTATELESNNKATQQRLNQKLLESLTEAIQTCMPPGDDSIATSAFPTIYGDEDQSVEVEEEHRKNQTREDAPDISNNSSGGGAFRRGRSLEADLVAMDRQASIRDIYGEMDIDDDELNSSGDLTGHSRGTLGRGKSLRDLCNIDTIEEEEGEEAEEVTSRHSDPGTILTAASEISARSASVRHIYGDDSVEIDDEQEAAVMRSPGQASPRRASDTPPVIAKRSVSVKTLLSGSIDEDDEECVKEQPSGPRDDQSDRKPWLADLDEASSRKDRPPSPIDRAESAHTVTSSTKGKKDKKDRAPSLVDRVVSTRAIYGEPEIDDSAKTAGSSDAPGVIGDGAVSTRAIYGEPDIDDASEVSFFTGIPNVPEIVVDRAVATRVPIARSQSEEPPKHESLSSILSGRGSLVDRAVSTRALVGEPETDESDNKSAAPADNSDVPDILDFYDGLDIDIDEQNAQDSVLDEADETDLYDNLSLDGVKETQAFVNDLDEAGSALGSELDELEDGDEVDEEFSVSIDGDSVPLSISSAYDSDSSGEDEEYFHDHARKHLSVLATSMAKVRAAKKATTRYNRFQETIFVSRREGPLAVKVKSVADYDAIDAGEKKMTLSDDESSGEDSGQEPALEQDSDENGSSVANSQESRLTQRDRSKASAFIVAMAVTDRRVADRAIRVYRKMLYKKFLPRRNRGPMALTERSDSPAPVQEQNNPPSDSSASGAYAEDPENGVAEQLAASLPSIDTGGAALDSSERALNDSARLSVSNPSIDSGSGFVVTSVGGEMIKPPAFPSPLPPKSGGLERQTTVDSVWKKQLQDESDSDSAGSNPPPAEGERMPEDPPAPQITAQSYHGDPQVEADPSISKGKPLQQGTSDNVAHRSANESPAMQQHSRQSPPHAAESEEGAFKPEQMPKQTVQGERKPSWKPFDESEGNLGEEKEIEEWETIANASSERTRAVEESKYGEESAILVDHILDMKAQIQKWEELFLVLNQNQKASNESVRVSNQNLQANVKESNDSLQVSHDALRVTNETLQTSIQESIEDSHHFAAYLDKMLTDRIGQLEEAIRSQTALATRSLVERNEQQVVLHPSTALVTTATPPRARSAPTSPMNREWAGPPGVIANRGIGVPFQDGESKEAENEAEEAKREIVPSVSSMVVEVTEWKRLQDKLRGTEEVAEAYRKQVLQLRNVLEVKINEGNASQHQVELLQRKLQDAHDREVQAQKQLRPVTRRVEQVIQEMVQLEEHSASLTAENGRLREQLWLAQREF